jgi:hypothetical protein
LVDIPTRQRARHRRSAEKAMLKILFKNIQLHIVARISHGADTGWHDCCSKVRQERKLTLRNAAMNIQLQTYRSEMNFSDIDASGFDRELDLQGSVPADDETLDFCGLSDDMMDDLREMVIY